MTEVEAKEFCRKIYPNATSDRILGFRVVLDDGRDDPRYLVFIGATEYAAWSKAAEFLASRGHER